MNLVKFLAPEFIFGSGARKFAAQYLKNLGSRRSLVVSDRAVNEAGWVEDILRSLDEEAIPHVLFLDLHPNPRDSDSEAGVEVYRAEGCDAILAIGGGSVIDCAKGIGILTANESPLSRYEGIDRIDRPGPPLVCVPTTSGSSADVSQFAIIRDMANLKKMAICSRMLVPDIALIDPEVTTTMGRRLTAAVGADAFVHAIEAFVSNASSPITDIHAIASMKTIPSALPRAMAEPGDMEARSQMSFASMEAGLAFSNAILGACHAMAHAVGGLLDAPHGECNSILLPEVVRANFPSAPEKYRQVAEFAGAAGLRGTDGDGDILAERLRQVALALELPTRLSELGLGRDSLEALAATALRDPCMLTNPRKLSQAEVVDIYERCF
jgi:alcohol dehydrogenase class IV